MVDDKVVAYENWLDVLKGALVEEVKKGDKTITRALNPYRKYKAGIGAVDAKDGVGDIRWPFAPVPP
jgi:malate synthase